MSTKYLHRILEIATILCLVAQAPDILADSRSDARRYFNRGMAAIEGERFEEGIELLDRAYRIRPHPNVLFNIGRAYERLGDLDNALRYLERYAESDPPDAEEVDRFIETVQTRLRLRRMVDEGMAAIAEGRYAEGVAFLERAYSVSPHPNLLYNIAKARERAGDLDLAIDAYERYLATQPKDADDVRSRLERLRAAKAELSARAPSPSADAQVDPAKVAEIVVAMLREQGGLVSSGPAGGSPTLDLTQSSSASDALPAKEGAGYEEVVVTASRRQQSPLDAPNAVTILSEEDIRLSGARSIPELLRRVPGMDVMAMSYSDWNVSMRGFNRRLANKILVLVDGRTVYQDFLGATVWPTLSIGMSDIERIEVVRGPGSAIYGAYAYTGIINVITKRPKQIDGAELELAAGNGGIYEGTLQYGKRTGPVGLRVSVGYRRGDKYDLEFDPARVDYQSGVEDPELSLERMRLDVESEYELSSGGRFFIGGGLNDGANEVYGVSALRNQAVDGLIANVRAGFSSDLFSVLVFWDRIQADSRPQFYPTGSPDLASTVRGDVVAVEPVFRPSFSLLGEHALVLGAEFRHKFVDWTYMDTKHEEDFFALFIQDEWSITDRWTLLVSARLDRHPLIGFLGSPRGAIVFKPGKGQAIRLSAGTAFRQPTQSETYLALATASGGLGVEIVGNRDLDPERILTVDLGYLNQGDFGQFEIVGYMNRVDDLIVRSELVQTGLDATFDPEINAFIGARSVYQNETATYLALGSEIAGRIYPADGVDIGASYAFQYIFDRDSGDRYTDSPLHKINAWGQLRTDFGLDLGLSASWTSSQLWIEEVGNPDATAPTEAIQRVSLPLDAYVVVSGRIGYRLFDDQLELAVSGQNLTDLGDARSRQHPLGNRVEARVVGSMTVRL